MHPAVQSAGLIITSAAAQLMMFVRPAQLAIQDMVMQVRSKISLAWVVVQLVEMSKYHVSTAIRTAIDTHVAEILREAGLEVTTYRPATLWP